MYRGIPQDYTNMSKEFKLPCVLDCPVCSDLKDTYKFYNNYNEKTGSLQMHKFNIAMALVEATEAASLGAAPWM